MSRLTILHINIIGGVVSVILAVGLYFLLIPPAQKKIKQNQAVFLDVQGRAMSRATNENNLRNALADQQRVAVLYGAYRNKYMPGLGYQQNAIRTMMTVFWPNQGKSFPERYAAALRKFMNGEKRSNSIGWNNPGVISLGSFGPDPNTIDADGVGGKFGPVLHYTYPMQVTAKSFAGLMRHIRNWPAIGRCGVPVIDNVQISGNSPNLNATYTVKLTVMVDEKAPTPDSRVSGSSAAGGAGGPGGPGGMRGYPGSSGSSYPGSSGSSYPGSSGPGYPGSSSSGYSGGGGSSSPPYSGSGSPNGSSGPPPRGSNNRGSSD